MTQPNISITVNGDAREIPTGTTVAALIQSLDLNPKFLAVERNAELVPRTTHADCVLEQGDAVEIVTLVGGG